MYCYVYDENHFYSHKQLCQLDPIASKREKKPVYLLSGNATWDEPPEEREGFLIKHSPDVEGSWIYEKDIRGKEYLGPDGVNTVKEENKLKVGEFLISSEDKELYSSGKKVYTSTGLVWASLSSLKEMKRGEINSSRDSVEQGGFSYLGKVFDSDQVSCLRMSCAAQALAQAPAGSTITWTCQDNSLIELDATQLSALVASLAEWSNTCHQKAKKLKALVDAALSPEEVLAINWNTPLTGE